MNPILVFLIVIVAITIWFFASFLFRPIGKFFYRLWKDAEDAINFEEKTNDEK